METAWCGSSLGVEDMQQKQQQQQQQQQLTRNLNQGALALLYFFYCLLVAELWSFVSSSRHEKIELGPFADVSSLTDKV